MPTVQAVLANAAHQDWEVKHIDMKSAYLNALLSETIYMKLPRGVLKPGQEGKVLRLLKGLYGLKQAGRCWHCEMSKVFINELRFKRSAIDHSMFYRHQGEEHMIIAVVTDDMALTTKCPTDAERVKSEIRNFWDISDHGPIQWFLGFEVKRDHTAKNYFHKSASVHQKHGGEVQAYWCKTCAYTYGTWSSAFCGPESIIAQPGGKNVWRPI